MDYNDLTVKRNITDDDFNRYVLTVAQNYFSADGDYTPYAAREALYYGFAKYCVETGNADLTYEEIKESNELHKLFEENKNLPYINEVKDMAKDMAEYEKQQRIYSPIIAHLSVLLSKETERINAELTLNLAAQEVAKAEKRLNNAQAEALEYQNEVNLQISPDEQASLIRRFGDAEFDIDKWTEGLVDTLTDKFYTSEAHKDNIADVIETKNEKIRELSKYKAAVDARNVMAPAEE